MDVPDDYLGVVTQLMALRKGTLIEMVNHGTGWVRMDYRVPARGLVGFRTEFMTETRGTGMLHHVFDGWEPWHGELKTKRNGSMVADRRGITTGYTLMSLQERGILLVGPATEVYEGMVIGENARDEEMDVNPTKEKKQTNVRSASADEAIRLTPPLLLSLEQALEFIADDECVEVTPANVRLRKVILDGHTRGRLRSRSRNPPLTCRAADARAEVGLPPAACAKSACAEVCLRRSPPAPPLLSESSRQFRSFSVSSQVAHSGGRHSGIRGQEARRQDDLDGETRGKHLERARAGPGPCR